MESLSIPSHTPSVSGATPTERPSVFEYLNFRDYLRDITAYLRRLGRYSERSFARRAGFRSSSHVRMVSAGQRNLSIEGSQKICKGFNLNSLETRFFVTLVQYGQATVPADQDRYYRRILTFKRFQKAHESSESEYSYFSQWQAVTLLEALGAPGWCRKTVSEMATHLQTSEAKVKDALDLLERLKLISYEGGQWIQRYSALHTSAETESLYLRAFHKQMLLRGIESIDQLKTDQRKLMGMTIRLDEKTWNEISELIFQKLKEWNATYSESPNPDKVYHFSVLTFPLASLK